MKTYIALDGSSGYNGSLLACQTWASNKVALGEAHLIHIVCCRGGEDYCRLVFEVSQSGISPLACNVPIKMTEIKAYV